MKECKLPLKNRVAILVFLVFFAPVFSGFQLYSLAMMESMIGICLTIVSVFISAPVHVLGIGGCLLSIHEQVRDRFVDASKNDIPLLKGEIS
jgi:hypothetical protein